MAKEILPVVYQRLDGSFRPYAKCPDLTWLGDCEVRLAQNGVIKVWTIGPKTQHVPRLASFFRTRCNEGDMIFVKFDMSGALSDLTSEDMKPIRDRSFEIATARIGIVKAKKK